MLITDKRVLQRQQMVLKFLGYYHGKCDGIWGPATVAAKRDFELSGKFNPSYPSNGLPFNQDGPFPTGIIRDYRNRALITHVDLTEDFINKHKSDLIKSPGSFNPNGEEAPVAEQPVEIKKEPTPVEDVTDSQDDSTSTDQRHDRPKQERHFNKHHNHKSSNK